MIGNKYVHMQNAKLSKYLHTSDVRTKSEIIFLFLITKNPIMDSDRNIRPDSPAIESIIVRSCINVHKCDHLLVSDISANP